MAFVNAAAMNSALQVFWDALLLIQDAGRRFC
jgi:hypothetical protein